MSSATSFDISCSFETASDFMPSRSWILLSSLVERWIASAIEA